MGRFTLPRDLYYGKDSLENLKNIDGKKAIVVSGGSSMRRGGFLDKVEAYLKEAGMEVQLFEGVEPDPSVETVMKLSLIHISPPHMLQVFLISTLPKKTIRRILYTRQCDTVFLRAVKDFVRYL